MVDTEVLKTSGFGCGGSSPPAPMARLLWASQKETVCPEYLGKKRLKIS